MLFISPSKLFTFSRYLSFCFDFLVIYKNSLIRKVRLISKFIKQTTAIHILSNISRNKGVQKSKFGPLIEHNMRNIFVKKIIHKMWWKNYSQTLFQKIKIEYISGSIVLHNMFLLYANLKAIEI